MWSPHTVFPKSCSVPVLVEIQCAMSGGFQKSSEGALMAANLAIAGLGKSFFKDFGFFLPHLVSLALHTQL